MVWLFDPGKLWWRLISSAAEATTTTPLSQAYSSASIASAVLLMAPSASCTTAAPLSTAKTAACAKSLTSTTNESPERTGMTRHSGHVPASPMPLFVSAHESRASPVPCPNSVSSRALLSFHRKSQPAMSST
jgi:hypothetical protein